MTKPERPELDHPCKETCSGWRQGYERGKAPLDEALREVERLKEQLDDCSALHKTAKAQFLELRQLKAEVERLSQRYSAIELANKEMSRNDHVTFGELMQEPDTLKAQVKRLKAENQKLLEDNLHIENKISNRFADLLGKRAQERDALKAELTLERECNAVLREGLDHYSKLQDWKLLPAIAIEALAREAEIRGEKESINGR